jgi:hypothetical protein
MHTGGSLDLNGWLLCGRHVTTAYDLNRQEFDKLIYERLCISHRAIAKNLNFGSVSVNEIITGMGLKKCILHGFCISLHPK